MRGRMIGSGSPGTQTSSSRLASPQIATSLMPEIFQRRGARVHLREAAVDDDEVGRVSELARALHDHRLAASLVGGRTASARGDRRPSPRGSGRSGAGRPRRASRRRRPRRRRARRLAAVGSRRPADGEAAVLRLAGDAVLEDDHRRDDVGALQARDVETFDTQRGVGQSERVLQLRKRPRTRRQVAGPAQLVLGESVFGVALRRSPAARACRRAAAPGSRPGCPAAASAVRRRRRRLRGAAGTSTSRGTS